MRQPNNLHFRGQNSLLFIPSSHHSTKVSANTRAQLWAPQQGRAVAPWAESSEGHLPPLLPTPSASPAPGPQLPLRPAWHPQHPRVFPSHAVPTHGLLQDSAEFSTFARIQQLTWKTCIYTSLVFPNCQPVPTGKGQRAPSPLKRKPL